MTEAFLLMLGHQRHAMLWLSTFRNIEIDFKSVNIIFIGLHAVQPKTEIYCPEFFHSIIFLSCI